jgi:hypothetical protein
VKRRFPVGQFVKWAGTGLAFLIMVTFAVSTRRAVTWDSRDGRHELALQLGAVGYGWRPASWRVEDEAYPTSPGLKFSAYGGHPRLTWWIERGGNSSWHWVSVPLWIPFSVVTLLSGMLWYRKRGRTVDAVG